MRPAVIKSILYVTLSLSLVAQDVTFSKTRFSSARQPNETGVDLSITESKISIKNKKSSAINIEIPYSSIDAMSYKLSKRHRVREGAGLLPPSPLIVLTAPPALIVMATKTKSHWLEIEYRDGGGSQSTVLRLDKSEYQKVIAALETKTGKNVVILDSKTRSLNPTAKSRDMDAVVPFPRDQVMTALKPAMESQGCKVKQATASRIECRRARGYSEQTGGGGESITVRLEPKGEQTRLRISTGNWSVTLLGGVSRVTKNWSTVIYQEMLGNLPKA